MDVEITAIRQKYWSLFVPLLGQSRCSNMPFPGGETFGICSKEITDTEDTGGGGIRCMVKYSYAFRYSAWRREAIKDMPEQFSNAEFSFINKNIRQLARIGTFKMWRRKGYAHELVKTTTSLLKVKYVECVTCHKDVAKLLDSCGFICHGWNEKAKAWYYLWTAE